MLANLRCRELPSPTLTRGTDGTRDDNTMIFRGIFNSRGQRVRFPFKITSALRRAAEYQKHMIGPLLAAVGNVCKPQIVCTQEWTYVMEDVILVKGRQLG